MATYKNARTLDAMLVAVTAIIAFALLYSGVLHASQPFLFMNSAAAYQILPVAWLGIPMLILPYIQISIACCLIFRIAMYPSLLLATTLFSTFAIAQGIVLWRGETLSCGCFGFSGDSISLRTVLIPLTCAAFSLVAIVKYPYEVQ